MHACFRCGAEVGIDGKTGFRESCERCGWDLHACRNCRYHDREAHNQCREPQAETVRDKERANYCEYFGFREGSGGSEPESDALAKARERAKKLFPF